MLKSKLRELRPFISILLIIFSLFSVVFIKMEVRRVGYSVLKEGRHYKKLRSSNQRLVMEYAKVTQPSRVRKIAMTRLTLNEARKGQIIQMSGAKIALRQ